jgi:hypothetical protein
LIEESRTNLITYSSDLTNAAWITQRATISGNATTAPDNTLTADKLVEDTTVTNNHRVYRGFFVSGTYSFTIFAKAGERSTLQVDQETGGGSRFLLTGSGTATATGANTVAITQLANGWYRCTTTFTTTGIFNIYISLNNGTTNFYTGDGTSGLFLWGGQVELASFATSYIPTVASQVTRTADVAVMTSTNFSNWYNASEGTFTAQYLSFASSGFPDVLNVSDGTINNRFQVFIDGSNGFTTTREIVAGVQQGISSITTTQKTNIRGSFAYSSAGVSAAINGAATVVGNNVTHPSGLNKLSLGNSATGVNNFLNGYLAKFAFYPQRLISAELQAFSK